MKQYQAKIIYLFIYLYRAKIWREAGCNLLGGLLAFSFESGSIIFPNFYKVCSPPPQIGLSSGVLFSNFSDIKKFGEFFPKINLEENPKKNPKSSKFSQLKEFFFPHSAFSFLKAIIKLTGYLRSPGGYGVYTTTSVTGFRSKADQDVDDVTSRG